MAASSFVKCILLKAAGAVVCAGALAGAAQGAVVATYLPVTVRDMNPSNVDGLMTATPITAGGVTVLNGFYNFNGSTGGVNGADPANVGNTSFLHATGMAPNGTGSTWTNGGGPAVDSASAVANNCYFTFALQPTAGNQLQLSGITFDVGCGSNTAIRGYDLRSSANNYATSLNTQNVDSSLYVEGKALNYVVVDLSSLPTITDAAGVTLRFYVWESMGRSGKNLDFGNIVVSGVTSAVPEPATLGLLGLGGLALLRRRQTR